MGSIAYQSYDYSVVYQTQEGVFQPISKQREVGWKNEAQLSC